MRKLLSNHYNTINILLGINMSLEKLFTGSATAKILDVLWEYQDIDLTLTDIADEAGIHYTTLMKALPLLEELNLVTMTRQVGNAKLYQISKDDIVVKRLIKFLNELNLRLAEREATKQGIPNHENEMILA
jgi:DNA-binding transcriptional ArsR family regulator